MMDKKKPNELPQFISDDEMGIMKDILTPDHYNELKYTMYELQGYLERNEWDNIKTFRDNALANTEHAYAAMEKVQGMVRKLKKDSERGFEKIRMQNAFMDRLRGIYPKIEDEEMTHFPMGDEIEKPTPTIQRPHTTWTSPQDIAEPKDPGIKVSLDELGQDPNKPIPQAEVRPDESEALTITDKVPQSDQEISKLSNDSNAFEKTEQKTAQIKETAEPDVKKKAGKKAKPKPKEANKKEYYDDRKQRVQDYIEDDQKRGDVDVSE